MGLLPVEEGAGLLAALATTVADLHELGLVHGAIAPEHVIIGAGGQPVLCSLGYGGRAGEAPVSVPVLPPGFVDPARAGAGALTAAFDVFGLGALARIVAPAPAAGHALARVADGATADDPTARPTARAVAELLQHEVPAARLPRGLGPQPPPSRPPPAPADPLEAWRRERGGSGGRRRPVPSRRATVMAAIVAVGVVGAVLLLTSLTSQRAARRPGLTPEISQAGPQAPSGLIDEAPSGPTTTRAGTASATTISTAAVRRRDCPPVTAVLQADVDGDGCAEGLGYADGILTAGGSRWSLGQRGDQVATGDWACQGNRTVALFRPSTGEVFRFDGWAEPGHDLRAAAIARVEGGQALRAADLDRDGCHEAVVERGTGPPEVIRLPPALP